MPAGGRGMFASYLGVARGREGKGVGWRKTKVIFFALSALLIPLITEEPKHLQENIGVPVRPSHESKQLI